MSRSIFGWSYPPGAANDPNAPYNQTDDWPCDVCGQPLNNCICPECPVCQSIGDPACYGGVVMCSWCGTRTAEQVSACITCNDETHPAHVHGITHAPVAGHGLVRSFAQVALHSEAERQWADDARAEAEAEAAEFHDGDL